MPQRKNSVFRGTESELQRTVWDSQDAPQLQREFAPGFLTGRGEGGGYVEQYCKVIGQST